MCGFSEINIGVFELEVLSVERTAKGVEEMEGCFGYGLPLTVKGDVDLVVFV